MPDGAPAIVQENASNDDAVKSIAGSTVENDCTLSWYTALFPLNCANTSTPFAGHARIPVSEPLVEIELGPSTAAPFSTGVVPSREPTMFAS